MVGCLGTDETGSRIQDLCQESRIELDHVSTKESSTIKIRHLENAHQLLRSDFETVLSDKYQMDLLNKIEKNLPNHDVLVLSDYDKGVIIDTQKFVKIAKKFQVPVLVDPKKKDWSSFEGVDLIKPNSLEFKNATGLSYDKQTALNLAKKYSINHLVVTLGSQGMKWCHDNEEKSYQGPPVNVFDVTGAGDTVMSVLSATHTLGWSIEKRMKLASQAASWVIQQTKTTPIQLDKLEAISYEEKIISQDLAITLSKSLKVLDQPLVVTNGCFDLLHPGHVRYLKQAKSFGQQLWVLVNSDSSIKRLKGNSRPINDLATRMEMLSSLECIDRVIAFDEDTPENLIKVITPDVLVKGGDYSIDQIAGAKWVKEQGGQVVIVPTFDGYSSSRIIKKCQNDL